MTMINAVYMALGEALAGRYTNERELGRGRKRPRGGRLLF